MEEEERGECAATAHFYAVVYTDEVVEVFSGTPVKQVANEVEAAFPGFVAAFVDVWAEVGCLVTFLSQ